VEKAALYKKTQDLKIIPTMPDILVMSSVSQMIAEQEMLDHRIF
jgi:hypothetical protein